MEKTENAVIIGSHISFLAENSGKLITTEYLCIWSDACSRYSHQSETDEGGSLHEVYNQLGTEWTSQESQIKPNYRLKRKHRRKSHMTEHAMWVCCLMGITLNLLRATWTQRHPCTAFTQQLLTRTQRLSSWLVEKDFPRLTRLVQISLVYSEEKSTGIAGVPCNVCDMPEDLSYIGVTVPRARNAFTPEHCRTLVYSSFFTKPLSITSHGQRMVLS